ncbi:PAS-domain containing protein [Inhella gelatinilytica]|uniref:Virulence sensor protein BvgS n=1 Tax=Inhella gelatinilytica TaxID=2795030 RepID=A0A931IXP6_9BURK|nr:PAS-domain containing protein [Inhella gelatinilytica]MBH9551761.1 PAS-domain containing protein [Inhella gelatinilytica]
MKLSRALKGWLWPVAVATGGVAVAIAGALWLQHQVETNAGQDFQRSVDRVSEDVLNRLQRPLYGLKGMRALFSTPLPISQDAFQAFWAARNLKEEFPGVRGMSFVEAVPQGEQDRYVAAIRETEAPFFTIQPTKDGEVLPQANDPAYVVRYIAPISENLAAVGLNIGSERRRREAIERAIQTGEPVLTEAIALAQDRTPRRGALLLVPMYTPGFEHEPPMRRPLRGLASAPIVYGDVLADITEVRTGLLSISVHDSTGEEAAVGAAVFSDQVAAPAGWQPRHQVEQLLYLPGRKLWLVARSTPEFEAAQVSPAPWLFLAGTAFVSLLLGVILRLQIRSRQQAERLAQSMTVDLERLALVASRTTNAVHITDAQRRILWVNQGFERLTGFSAAETVGRTARELLRTHTDSPLGLQRLDEALRTGQSYRGELRIFRKDGEEVWVGVDIQALHDEKGRLRGFTTVQNDINALKRVEHALERERHSLANILEGTSAGTWEWNIQTGAVRFNERWANMLGYSLAELEPLSIQTWRRLVHPDDLREAEIRLRAHFEGRSDSFDCELRMQHQKGSWVWVLSRGKLFSRTADHAPEWMAGTHQDITAQHALAAELRGKTELLNTVLEHLPCGLSVFDGQLELVLGNQAYRDLLEFPDHLFDGEPIPFERFIRFNAERGEYGPGDVDAQVQAIVERARGPASPHQFERTRPNGKILEVRGGPLPGGGFVTTYTDITSRRQAESEAQRAGDLLRHAIDALDEAFVLYDPDDRLVFCNERYRQTYPVIADLIHPGVAFESLVRAGAERGEYAEAIGRVDAWVRERVTAHQAANSTVTQPLSDGRWLRIVERKLPDGHIVGFRIDITELMRATEAAQAASQAKSQFVANMSHEIRTPMNAILGLLALLERTPLTPRQVDYTGKAAGAARSLLGLLNDILDFSKAEAGKLELDPQPFALEELLKEVGVVLAAQLGAKPVELVFDVAPDVPTHWVGDALRLRQVLINLGSNAVKFTAAGEVVLRVTCPQHSDSQARLRVEVHDTGVGIAPEHHARIFSGFSQAEASITRRFGGTGLGVAISQRLVTLMAGELQLRSTLGAGSCFFFEVPLPLSPGPTRAFAASTPVVVPPLPPVQQRAVDQVLARYTPATEPHAASAPCLLDIGSDERQTLAEARARVAQGHAPVVILCSSAHRLALDEQVAEPIRLLTKPFTPEQLAQALWGDHLSPASAPIAAPGRLGGLRLLLVEDNPVNQQVALELLRLEGAQVELAMHGLEAVEALRRTPGAFDAVLMDVQMPVMDGYTATRTIREALGLRDLFILAMTANALRSDREACLAAGMDGHIGKPFEIDQLVAALRTRLELPDAPAADPPAMPELPAEWVPRAQALGLDLRLAWARFMGQARLLRRSCEGVLDSLGDVLHLLNEPDTDADARRHALHSLKGMAATVGLSALADLAFEGEQAAREGLPTPPGCVQGLAQLQARLDPTLRDLMRALAPDQDEAIAWNRQGVESLRRLLRAGDLEALEAHAEWRALQPSSADDVLHTFDEALAELNLSRAADALDAAVPPEPGAPA